MVFKAKPSFIGLALALVMGGTTAWSGNSLPAGLPDPSTGQIDGKVAITVAPQALGKSGVLATWGFLAHLTGYDEPDVDFVFPCGIWSQPPRGRYRLWVEGEWKISPFTHVIRYSPQPFHGQGFVASAEVGEAGRVTLPPEIAKRPDLVLRLLHADSYLDEGYPRWELSRRKKVQEVGEGLLMPVGLTLAALWDGQSQSYSALSRPFEVKAHQTVVASFEQSSGVSHLIVQIQRPNLASTAADVNMQVVLRRKGLDLPPDLLVSLTDRAYGVWYGLAPGPGELRAETRDAVLEPKQLSLPVGGISYQLEKMTPRPAWAR